MAKLVAVLDFEASCLAQPDRQSYPIEVAVGFPETGEIRSWIIRPEPEWLAEWDWSFESEKLHGLTQATLLAQGQSRSEVAQLVEAAIEERRLLSDNPVYEEYWLSLLLQRRVSVGSLDSHLLETAGGGMLGQELIIEATAAAERSRTIRHRARADVAFCLSVLRRLQELTS
jgi:hypothetical protein